MEVFIPFSEAMVEKLGLDLGRLVPFQLEYECLHFEEATPEIEDGEVGAASAAISFVHPNNRG